MTLSVFFFSFQNSLRLLPPEVLNVRTCGNEINKQSKSSQIHKNVRLNFTTIEKHSVTYLTCLRDWGCGVGLFFNKQMQMLREKRLDFWHCSLLTELPNVFHKQTMLKCLNVCFIKPPPRWTLKNGIHHLTVNELTYLIFVINSSLCNF